MKRIVSLILIAALLAACLSGCGLLRKLSADDEPDTRPDPVAEEKQSVQDMADRCVSACNNLDPDGILNCVAPAIAKPAKTMMNLAGELSGKDDDEMLETILGLLGAEGTTDAHEVCETLEVSELQNVEVDGDTATAEADFTYEMDGETYVGHTTVTCKCIDGEWYIYRLSSK